MHPLKIFSVGLLIGLFCTGHAMAIEEPKYEVVQTEGAFEIRKYAPILVAETFVDGDMDEASNKGFRLIADFIFGNNQIADSSASSKIAMTAPVTVDMQAAKKWRIHFVMPSQYTLANIPKPKNEAVSLKEIQSKYFLVYTYSWLNTLSRVQTKTDEAIDWANRKGLKVIGAPQLSRYDPPWTPPMFKRNEIMLEVAAP